MRILIFSPPFSGHLNILKKVIRQKQNRDKIKLIITGWKNIPADISNINCSVEKIEQTDLRETDPALWTLPRVAKSLNQAITLAKTFKPDVILYDFFSLEGYFVGKLLEIPYWCSIPAMIGPNNNTKYLQKKLSTKVNQNALKKINKESKINITIKDFELISDGIHLPGQKNIVWSYKTLTPKDFRRGRKRAKYVFAGNLEKRQPHKKNKKPQIYFSLGTVVLNNIWNQQPTIRKPLRKFIAKFAKLTKDEPYNILFASQGKKVLRKYPNNWKVVRRTDQGEALTCADIFITHGGSNSFHEAVMRSVPMIVIPFFGDQPLIGKQVDKLGIGMNLIKDSNIDTKKSKQFLNEALAKKLHNSIKEILHNKKYENAFEKLDLK